MITVTSMAKVYAQAPARMILRLSLLALGIAAGVAVVLWSPVLLLSMLGDELPWADLSDVGEAYGGASALLAAAALSGIAASLVLQARQARQEMISADRQRHFELIKLALDDPELFEAVDGVGVAEPDGRKKVFASLFMGYWLALWELRDLREGELRANLSRMFGAPLTRDWWEDRHGTWIEVRNRRQRRFVEIATDEWRKAGARAAAHPPVATSPKAPATPAVRALTTATTIAFAGIVVAAHLGLRARNRRGTVPDRTRRSSHH